MYYYCSLVPRPSPLYAFIIRATFEPLDIEKLSRGSKVARIINAYSGEGLGTRLLLLCFFHMYNIMYMYIQ